MSKIAGLLVRLGLLREAEAPASAPAPSVPRPTTRVVSLKDLTRGIDDEREATERLFDSATWDVADHQIYSGEAFAAPAHGWTSLKVVEALDEDASLEPPAQQAALVRRLDEARVPLQDVLDDARRRDDALDAHEAHLQQRLKLLDSAADKRRRDIDAEIQKLQDERAETERLQQSARKKVEAWVARKRSVEDRLEIAVTLLGEVAARRKTEAEPVVAEPGRALGKAEFDKELAAGLKAVDSMTDRTTP